MRALICLALLLGSPSLAETAVIDGRLDEDHWQDARVFDQFVTTQPLTLATPQYPTRVRLVATADGLLIGFENSHPPELSRTRAKKPRDQSLEADRVSVMIDFQNNGSTAYEFTVSLANSIQDGIIADQKRFSYDWDGFWEHAVSESDTHWYVELRVPWSAVPAAKGRGDQRNINVFFSRVIHERGIRYSFPGASWERPTFVADFHPVSVPNFKSSLLDFFPYATAIRDERNGDEDFDGGLDLFWKPNGNHQVTLTINPDFGQVESDDLIVNFSAVEAFFSEKRPFFTENQALFDMSTTKGGRLIHTRRIGASHDNPEAGPADILAALKYTGQAANWEFGVFGAAEDDADTAQGSDFYVARARYNGQRMRIGAVAGWTDRPTLDRDALMTAVDLEFKPKPGVLVRGQIINTRAEEAGEKEDGRGAWVRADWSPNDSWSIGGEMSRYDASYDINDLGFMSRNDVEDMELNLTRRKRTFSAKSPIQEQELEGELAFSQNTAGDHLPVAVELAHTTQFKNTAELEIVMEHETTGMDDRVTRGNNLVRYPKQTLFYVNYVGPSVGVFRYDLSFLLTPEAMNEYAWEVEPSFALFINDNLNLSLQPNFRKGDEWLIWERDNDLASFRHETWDTALNLDWFPARSQELRLKFQWIGISARGRDRYRAAADGTLNPVAGPVDDFVVSNSGLQIRYRYLLGPLTEIAAVYSRGGDYAEMERTLGFSRLFAAGWRETIADQFFLKVRYRL
ncbi:DUF5916 domain-containing protein [Acanthopleuribacter pedis]|uniref:DUF5916 domain-containing protein n=1 Tax=Acanthopleuribacter pedis TaxID=442870 RepID=A0A8J7Q6G8_9BACT|nr:DUF5916 domain-containing protein [Acanthopleuribacter pedis]MBO1317584.1 hypothetical protein [Acanthopleuribacter pedis]